MDYMNRTLAQKTFT